jgi:TP901 family phage tail tape measure protein
MMKISSSAEGASLKFTELNSILGVAGTVFSALSAAVAKTVVNFAGFEKALAEVSTLLDDTATEMPKIERAALDLAGAFGSDAVSQTKAFYQAISAGASDAAEATAVMTEANKLALGGVTNIETAVDGLTSVMNAYGLTQDELTSAADTFFVGMKKGKTTVGLLASEIGRVAPTAKAAGVSFQELTAAISAVTTGGIRTDQAVVGVNQALVSILKPTKQAKEEAQRLGIEFDLSAIKSRGFKGILDDVTKSSKFTDDSLFKLFGNVRAQKAVLALVNNEGGKFNEILEAMDDRAGAAAEATEKMKNTLDFEWGRFTTQMDNMNKSLGESISNFLGLKEAVAGAATLLEDLQKAEAKPTRPMRSEAAEKAIAQMKLERKAQADLRKDVEELAKIYKTTYEEQLHQLRSVEGLTAVAIKKRLAEEKKSLAEMRAEMERHEEERHKNQMAAEARREERRKKAREARIKEAEKLAKKIAEMSAEATRFGLDLEKELRERANTDGLKIAKEWYDKQLNLRKDYLASIQAAESNRAAREVALEVRKVASRIEQETAMTDAAHAEAVKKEEEQDKAEQERKERKLQMEQDFAMRGAQAITGGFRAAMQGGKAFEGFILNMLDRLASEIATGAFLGILGSIFGIATGGIGGIVGAVAGLFKDGGVVGQGGRPMRAQSGLRLPDRGPDVDRFHILASPGERVLSRDQNRAFEAGMSMGGGGGTTNVFNVSAFAMNGPSFLRSVRDDLIPQQRRLERGRNTGFQRKNRIRR